MQGTVKIILASLAIWGGSAALAQQTATEESAAPEAAQAPTAAEQPPADAPAALLPDDPAQAGSVAEIAVGQPYIRAQFDDWAQRCLREPEGQNDPCQLYQLLLDKNGAAVAEFSMSPLPDGAQAAAVATIVAPLETLLTQQLTLSVDGGQTRRYPFQFCNAAGCVARVGFTNDEVLQFKRGNVASLRLVPAREPGNEFVLSMSLKGFTAAYDSTAPR